MRSQSWEGGSRAVVDALARRSIFGIMGPMSDADIAFLERRVLPWAEAVLASAEAGLARPDALKLTADEPLDLVGSFETETAVTVDAGDAPTAFQRVSRAAGLDPQSRALLALSAAPYLLPAIGVRLGDLQGSPLADRLTVGLAVDLLHPDGDGRVAALRRFDPESALLRWGLVQLVDPLHHRGDGLVDKVICVPQRTLDLLSGVPRLDERLRGFCRVDTSEVQPAQVVVPADRRAAVMGLVLTHDRVRAASGRFGFDRAIPYGRGIVILFAGPPGTGKTLFARALANAAGRPLLRVYSDKLAESQEAIEPVIRALFDEAQLHGAIVFFDECEALFGRRGPKLGYLLSELELHDGVVLLATNLPQQLDAAMDRRILYRMDFEVPDASAREEIWELHLPPEAPLASDVDIPALANLYNFPGGAIKNAVLVALARAFEQNPTDPRIDMATLLHAARSQLKYNLDELALRSRISLTLDDLVLPPNERQKLDEILSACRHKDVVQNRWGLGGRLVTGKGISILFDGPPGTGKTLGAEILARELDCPLFRVNIPNVVSKWVGETEKNISEIFARAQATQAILLFDEADSLFAKRTEVKSSNDRYSNQEVNLLLQEIERYTGVVILTTNLFGGLDDAVRRRIQYRITFPQPGAPERAAIWERLMPPRAPLAPDVDFAALARTFEFAGGNIKNAIVRACYRAYGEEQRLTQRHLMDAGRIECESAGMIVREGTPTRLRAGAATSVARVEGEAG